MRRLKNQLVFAVIATFAGLVGASVAIGFLSLALYLALASSMSAAMAAILTAFIILLTTTLIIVIARAILIGAAPQPEETVRGGHADVAAEIGKLFGGQAREFAARHSSATLLGSLAVGFMVGMSPGLRDLLRRGL